MTARVLTHGIHHPPAGTAWSEPHARVDCIRELCGFGPWRPAPADLRLVTSRDLLRELWRRYNPLWRYRVWRCNRWMLAHEGRPCANPDEHRKESHG